MSYEVLRYIFIIAAVLSGLMLAVSVLVFFLLKIPKVVGYLSGSTARKAINSIRNGSDNSGDRVHPSVSANRERGRVTDKITASGRIVHQNNNPIGGGMSTAKIPTQAPSKLGNSNETTVLDVESGNETTILDGINSAFAGNSDETTVLGQQNNQNTSSPDWMTQSGGFEVEYEIMFIHTNEIIT